MASRSSSDGRSREKRDCYDSYECYNESTCSLENDGGHYFERRNRHWSDDSSENSYTETVSETDGLEDREKDRVYIESIHKTFGLSAVFDLNEREYADEHRRNTLSRRHKQMAYEKTKLEDRLCDKENELRSLQRKLRQHKDSLDHCVEEMELLQRRVFEKDTTIYDLLADKVQSEVQTDDLNREIRQKENYIAELEGRVGLLHQEIKNSTLKRNNYEMLEKELKLERESKCAMEKRYQMEEAKLRKEIKGLRSQEEWLRETKRLRKKLREAEHLIANKEKEVSALNLKLKHTTEEKDKTITTLKKALTFHEEALRNSESSKDTKIKKLNNEIKSLRQNVQETKKLHKNKEINDNIRKLEQTVREQEKEISKLKSDLDKQNIDKYRTFQERSFKTPEYLYKVDKQEEKRSDLVNEELKEKNRKLEKDLQRLSEVNKRLQVEITNEKENARKIKDKIDNVNTELSRKSETQRQKIQDLEEKTKLLEQNLQKEFQEKIRLQKEFDAYKENVYRREFTSLDENTSKTHKELERCHQEKLKLLDELSQERLKIKRVEEDNRRQKGELQQQIKNQLRELERLRATNDELTGQVNDISKKTSKDLEHCMEEKKTLQDQFAQERVKMQRLKEDARRQKCDLQQQIKNMLREIETLKASNQELTRQINDVSKQKTVNSSPTGNDELRRQLEATNEQLRKALKDRDEAQTRLSRAMGDRLTDNNPNIADLSDKNRPTKLSERYQELYDNQWTDAFEIIDRNFKDEENTIATLKTLLTRAMEFCKTEAVRQLKQVEEIFAKGARIPKDMVKPLKDYRKALAEQYGEGLYKDYVRHLSRSHSEEDSLALQVPAFVKECFDICWLMAVQDPPVVLGPDVHRGSSFNKDHYKAYTKSGERVKYTVWPVLLLHEAGPVLCKGVAQGN